MALVNPVWRRLPHWRTCAPSLCPRMAWPRSATGPVCPAKALWPFWSISMGSSVAKGKEDEGMSFLAPFSCRIPGWPVLHCHSQTWIWQVWKYTFNWRTLLPPHMQSWKQQVLPGQTGTSLNVVGFWALDFLSTYSYIGILASLLC